MSPLRILRGVKANGVPFAAAASRPFSSTTRRMDQIAFKVTGQGTGVAQKVQVDGAPHTITTDTYPAFGGADSAPSPLAINLAALSSCTQVTGSIVARDHGITLSGWDVGVTGQFDPAVLVNGEKDNGNGGNWNSVHLAVKVKAENVDDKQFQHWWNEVERRCPVTQLFKKSGATWTSDWSKA